MRSANTNFALISPSSLPAVRIRTLNNQLTGLVGQLTGLASQLTGLDNQLYWTQKSNLLARQNFLNCPRIFFNADL